ncbi:hypothetical protein [Hymenobacter frigidus]|nr:hypothetical protein [Hymenobacter frigidus]
MRKDAPGKPMVPLRPRDAAFGNRCFPGGGKAGTAPRPTSGRFDRRGAE